MPCATLSLAKGVIAQFAYVGAQVGVGSFIIRFAEFLTPGTSDKVAADYLKYHWIGFMIGRFAGSFLMKYIQPSRLLSLLRAALSYARVSRWSPPERCPSGVWS